MGFQQLKQQLRRGWHIASEKTGFANHAKPHDYTVRYSLHISNTSRESLETFVLLPHFWSGDYQLIQESETFSVAPAFCGTDKVHGNRFSVWELSLQPGGSRTIAMDARLKVMPREMPSQYEGRISHYNATDEECQKYVAASQCVIISPEVKAIARGIPDNDLVITTLQAINTYVISHLQYGDPIPGLYNSAQALSRQCVDCGGYVSLFVALCRAKGIPARIVAGFWAQTDSSALGQYTMHAWVEVMLPHGQWIAADPSVEQLRQQGRTKKSGSLGFVGSDRIAMSVGCDIHVSIKDYSLIVPLLQNPYFFSSYTDSQPSDWQVVFDVQNND